MHRRTFLFLIFIVVLAVGTFWVDFGFGKSPSIDFGGYKNPLTVNQGLDLQGGIQVVMQVNCPDTNKNCDRGAAMSAIVDNLQRRIAGGLAVNDAVVRTADNFRVFIELPGLTDDRQALQLLGQTGQMNIIDTGANQVPVGTDVTGQTCRATCASGQFKIVFTGDQLDTGAIQAGIDQQSNQPIVQFAFKGQARNDFANYTLQNVGKFLTVTLDNKVIESATIQSQITGNGQITGIPNLASAQDLASLLKYGSLPLPLTVASLRQLAPTLGQQALDQSKIAGIIGLGMVILFMLFYYRLPGLLADMALVLYAGFLFAIIKLLGITLSLPGIAATVLTVGMAVDANVLIFERVKEELRAGRTMAAAIDIGFKRAWPSIRDSNASTLITCFILYWFGNTFGATLIIGFAINLGIGVVISLFTAVLVTRNFLHLLILSGIASHPAWYGLPRAALPIARYNRPVSRVSPTAARASLVPPKAVASKAVAATDGNDSDDMDDDAEFSGDDTLEAVTNSRNGRTPTAGRSGVSGATGGAEE